MPDTSFTELTISSVISETEEAVRIGFAVPGPLRERFRFAPGQYLTLRMKIDGEDVSRSYSICSGINDPEMRIAIKRVDGGSFSNFANESLKVGDVVEVMAPQGTFSAALDPDNENRYLFIAAGSGITPVISNVSSVLQYEPGSEVTLLYGNQRSHTIMFREALSFLKNRFMNRLHWVNILSREDQGCALLNGRLDSAKSNQLNQRLIDLGSFDEYFICGPESMVSELSRVLRGLGVAADNIHYELFASSADDAQKVIAKHRLRAESFAGKVSDVMIILDGRSFPFTLAADGENLLDSAIKQGLDLPFSCKGGVCSTCKAKLVEGKVDMDITHGLESSEIESGYILVCQAHPITDRVVLDYDQK